jgi:hypothetical protein
MAIPVHLNTAYRYKETLAVTDVQTIINDLCVELVTSGGWTCTLGGSGQTPTTFKSPVRSDGLFWTIKCTRISATRIAYIVNDHSGMLVNNATDTRQDIDAGGTVIQYFTGPFHVCVNSARTTPECWYSALLDQTPEPIGTPRPTYVASYGPRDTAGTWLLGGYYYTTWMLKMNDTVYRSGDWGIMRKSTDGNSRKTHNGALLCEPLEFTDTQGWLMGRLCQAFIVDSTTAFGADVTIPLDGVNTGVFKVVGSILNMSGKLAFRKS